MTVHFGKYRAVWLTVFAIILCFFIFTMCVNKENDQIDTANTSRYNLFAGSEKCANCHKEIYNSHIHTAHFNTSGIAFPDRIKGNFDTGKNIFAFNELNQIKMEKSNAGLYQVAYINGKEKKRERFDLFFGSGTKGQSFGSWVQNKLVQLPITYFTSAGQWSNSPGYPNKIAFNRPITSRCLECHTTYAYKLSPEEKEPEEFDKTRMILGVDCETCHGAGKMHVDFQSQNPAVKTSRYIINPAALTRQQNLDMCALCHGGKLQKSKPSFEFTAGKNLADYFAIDTAAKNANNIDVHGNQYGLMAASKCFRMTNTLTCNTCHNTHENEKGKTEIFSQRCMNCHNTGHKENVVCKLVASLNNSLKKNCIDCHMPEQPSMAIAVTLQGASAPVSALMHTHYIKVYDEETKKVLAYLKNNNKGINKTYSKQTK